MELLLLENWCFLCKVFVVQRVLRPRPLEVASVSQEVGSKMAPRVQPCPTLGAQTQGSWAEVPEEAKDFNVNQGSVKTLRLRLNAAIFMHRQYITKLTPLC